MSTRVAGRGRRLLPLVIVAVALAIALVLWLRPRPARYAGAWVSLPVAEAAAVKNVHAHAGAPVCQRCHVERSGELLGGAEAQCGACHAFHSGNHPVGVAPKQIDAKADLPLAAGKLACFTCHDPHDVSRNGKGLRLSFDQLCLACHFDKRSGSNAAR